MARQGQQYYAGFTPAERPQIDLTGPMKFLYENIVGSGKGMTGGSKSKDGDGGGLTTFQSTIGNREALKNIFMNTTQYKKDLETKLYNLVAAGGSMKDILNNPEFGTIQDEYIKVAGILNQVDNLSATIKDYGDRFKQKEDEIKDKKAYNQLYLVKNHLGEYVVPVESFIDGGRVYINKEIGTVSMFPEKNKKMEYKSNPWQFSFVDEIMNNLNSTNMIGDDLVFKGIDLPEVSAKGSFVEWVTKNLDKVKNLFDEKGGSSPGVDISGMFSDPDDPMVYIYGWQKGNNYENINNMITALTNNIPSPELLDATDNEYKKLLRDLNIYRSTGNVSKDSSRFAKRVEDGKDAKGNTKYKIVKDPSIEEETFKRTILHDNYVEQLYLLNKEIASIKDNKSEEYRNLEEEINKTVAMINTNLNELEYELGYITRVGVANTIQEIANAFYIEKEKSGIDKIANRYNRDAQNKDRFTISDVGYFKQALGLVDSEYSTPMTIDGVKYTFSNKGFELTEFMSEELSGKKFNDWFYGTKNSRSIAYHNPTSKVYDLQEIHHKYNGYVIDANSTAYEIAVDENNLVNQESIRNAMVQQRAKDVYEILRIYANNDIQNLFSEPHKIIKKTNNNIHNSVLSYFTNVLKIPETQIDNTEFTKYKRLLEQIVKEKSDNIIRVDKNNKVSLAPIEELYPVSKLKTDLVVNVSYGISKANETLEKEFIKEFGKDNVKYEYDDSGNESIAYIELEVSLQAFRKLHIPDTEEHKRAEESIRNEIRKSNLMESTIDQILNLNN